MQEEHRHHDDGVLNFRPSEGYSDASLGILDPSRIRITHRPVRLEYLITQIQKGELPLTPPFRRESNLWDDGVQSRFIESLFVRIPIPAFFFVATGNKRLLVGDGVKRLTAIARFILDNRVLGQLELEKLKLCQLDFLPDLNGKTYDELAPIFRRRIMDTQVAVYTIDQRTPPAVRYNLFKRICAGEEPRSAQEIRHALNIGTATNFLAKLANLVEFFIATHRKGNDKRVLNKSLLDHEYVLRFIAFTLSPYMEYNHQDIDLFLNESMARINLLQPDALAELEQQFKKAMGAAYEVFERYTFRETDLTGDINGALLETWSVNLGQLPVEDIANLVEKKQYLIAKFHILLSNHDFKDAITRPTNNTSKVKTRFKMVDDFIKEIVQVADPWKNGNIENTYKEGARIKKKIVGVVPYGAFAELEEGLYGLIHTSDLSWTSSEPNPTEFFKAGDEVEVVVLEVDLERKRISLSYMRALWKRLQEIAKARLVIQGKISRIVDFGAFAELEKGIEGLIHTSNLPWTLRGPDPNEYFKVGDEVEVVVLEVDLERKRISLSYKDDLWTRFQQKDSVGSIVRGKIVRIADYGVIVELEKGIVGLIHNSNLSWTLWEPDPNDFFKIGDEIEVIVLEVDVDRKRISLSYKHTKEDPWPRLQKKYRVGSVVQGKIVKFDPLSLGAFVELEKEVVGYIPAKDLRRAEQQSRENPGFGDKIDVEVVHVPNKGGKIQLTWNPMPKSKSQQRKKHAKSHRSPRHRRLK